MTPGNQIELHVPSVMEFEKVAMECAATAAKNMGFTEDRVEGLKTAVAEACLNAIEHGNKMDTSKQGRNHSDHRGIETPGVGER